MDWSTISRDMAKKDPSIVFFSPFYHYTEIFSEKFFFDSISYFISSKLLVSIKNLENPQTCFSYFTCLFGHRDRTIYSIAVIMNKLCINYTFNVYPSNCFFNKFHNLFIRKLTRVTNLRILQYKMESHTYTSRI